MDARTELQLLESISNELTKLQCLVDNALASRKQFASQDRDLAPLCHNDEPVFPLLDNMEKVPCDIGHISDSLDEVSHDKELEILDSLGCYHDEAEVAKIPDVGINDDGLVAPMDLVHIGASENTFVNGVDQVNKLQKSTLADDPYWTAVLTASTPVRMRLLLSQFICSSTCDLLQLVRSCKQRMMRLQYDFNGPGSWCSIVRTYDGFNGPGSSQDSFNFGLALMRDYDGFNGPGSHLEDKVSLWGGYCYV